MDNRKKDILKLSMGIGGFIAVLVYIWFVFMQNNYAEGFSSAVMFGVFAAIGSYMIIQNSIPQNYPISTLTRKIIISVVMFFGILFLSSSFMIDYWGFESEIGVMLGLVLAFWTTQYYAVGRQNKLKRKEKEAKAREEAEMAKITKEAEKKEREIQKEEQRKAWFSKLENDLA